MGSEMRDGYVNINSIREDAGIASSNNEVQVDTDIGTVRVTISMPPSASKQTTASRKREHRSSVHPVLLTIPDIGLNHISCYQALYLCAQKDSLLTNNFCTYHLNFPGHSPCSAASKSDLDETNYDYFSMDAVDSLPLMRKSESHSATSHCESLVDIKNKTISTDDIIAMIIYVMKHLKIEKCVMMGLGYGGQLAAKLAVMHPERVIALILMNPTAGPPTWLDAIVGELRYQSLYYRGITESVINYFLNRYFRMAVRGRNYDSNLCLSMSRELKTIDPVALASYMRAFLRREAIASSWCRFIQCETLIIVGDKSVAKDESLMINAYINISLATLVLLDDCGLLATEECPEQLLSPIELFIQGLIQRGITK